MAMKHEIDNLMASDPHLQKFLCWIYKKSNNIKTQYKSSAVRAFYIYLFARASNIIPLTSDELFRKLDPKLNNDVSISQETAKFLSRNRNVPLFGFLSYALVRIRILDLFQAIYLALFFAHELALDCTLSLILSIMSSGKNAIELFGDLSLSLTLALNLTKELHEEKLYQELQILREQMPDPYKDCNALQKWQQTDRIAWQQELLVTVIENRDVAHDWQFSNKQIGLLLQYVAAYEILVDCLNSKYHFNEEIRQGIENTLLLPVEHI